jgi:hypothetical protein
VTELQYPAGIDFAWLGRDKLGNVAAFVTGGCGPIPREALWQVALPVAPEETLLSLPLAGEARLLGSYANMQSFGALAKRGVFVYDWSDVHRVSSAQTGLYELVAAPAVPLAVEHLVAFESPLGVVAASFPAQQTLAVQGVQT